MIMLDFYNLEINKLFELQLSERQKLIYLTVLFSIFRDINRNSERISH